MHAETSRDPIQCVFTLKNWLVVQQPRKKLLAKIKCEKSKITHTHTQPFYCWSGICLGPPGSAGTRKVKTKKVKNQSGFTGARDRNPKFINKI